MIVSLYHRLLGIQLAIAWHFDQESTAPLKIEMETLLTQFCQRGEVGNWEPTWTADPLANGFLLLPVFLFFHEDPDYLGDRLSAFSLPATQQDIIFDLAQLISGCLREKFTSDHWIDQVIQSTRFGPGFRDCLRQGQTWHGYQKTVQSLGEPEEMQGLLLICGAIAKGYCRWPEALALAQSSPAVVRLWVAILLGALRGDRHFPLLLSRDHNRREISTQVLEFWSRWSGLPLKNQLQLDQLPLIASQSVLQYRPQLQLISQCHSVK